MIRNLSLDKLIATLFFAFLFLPAATYALDAGEGEYTVQKGDTLWTISSGKLKDAFLWPELWKSNPQLKNPHMIYPGQKLNLIDESGQTGKGKKHSATETITERPKKNIIAPDKVTAKKVSGQKKQYFVPLDMLLQSGYIYQDFKHDGKVLASRAGKLIMGKGDYVYVETGPGISSIKKFFVMSQPEQVLHPKTEEAVGNLIRVKGVLELSAKEGSKTTALITESYEEIVTDDLLKRHYEIEPPFDAKSEKRAEAEGGIVIKLTEGKILAGSLQVAYLDRGSMHGIEIGDIFKVLSQEEPYMPIGQVRIINVGEKTSVALIIKAEQQIGVGDKITAL
ncbi:MAG: LysM peptidoglycan-binding domain-containing protein [Nitrospirae bacterium]|nr:LysM peptidoglycan-binding domain-containing protein [Nitrospirota bacterium]